SQQNPRVANEEGAGGRQHQRDAAARRNTAPRKLGGAALCGGVKLAEAERRGLVAAVGLFSDVQVRAPVVMLGPVATAVDERLGGENAFGRPRASEPLRSSP